MAITSSDPLPSLEAIVFNQSIVQPLRTVPNQPNIELMIKRDDLIHPIISGNKIRKLASLTTVNTFGFDHIVTMGGNRSNFLHALSYLCYCRDIKLTALIRGPEPQQYSATLNDLKRWNTEIIFVNREEYKSLRNNSPESALKYCSEQSLWVPEGGSNGDAVLSTMEAIDELEIEPTSLFVPLGTGCTALGLAAGIEKRGWKTKIIAVVTLKGAVSIEQSMKQLAYQANIGWPNNLILDHNYCGRGFGKVNPELLSRLNNYEKFWQVPIDPVYGIKMFDALTHYLENSSHLIGDKVLLWHTGGAQGKR
ncbi:MAG: pyridoxal-phosphate dependent enzyme [Kangiellaceae bacterium]|jgi:1-aminocyclopropane-1-carboxylate deaminase|nr:pyridoxal-phosphate dependent enzyme [Kangiellaceae bacterium]